MITTARTATQAATGPGVLGRTSADTNIAQTFYVEQCFPDKPIRRTRNVVVLCVLRDLCGELKQDRDWLDDHIEDELEFTLEFERAIE